MRTALDTNVVSDLWTPDPAVSKPARAALETAAQRGALVMCGAVFAELLAAPGRSQALLDEFVVATGASVDWSLDEPIWRAAGAAYQAHANRRRPAGASPPRRLLADFVIGAHAARRADAILTSDPSLYRRHFAGLRVEVP